MPHKHDKHKTITKKQINHLISQYEQLGSYEKVAKANSHLVSSASHARYYIKGLNSKKRQKYLALQSNFSPVSQMDWYCLGILIGQKPTPSRKSFTVKDCPVTVQNWHSFHFEDYIYSNIICDSRLIECCNNLILNGFTKTPIIFKKHFLKIRPVRNNPDAIYVIDKQGFFPEIAIHLRPLLHHEICPGKYMMKFNAKNKLISFLNEIPQQEK